MPNYYLGISAFYHDSAAALISEIDIIAARRHTLIFVEVKARAKLDDAAWSITLQA